MKNTYPKLNEEQRAQAKQEEARMLHEIERYTESLKAFSNWFARRGVFAVNSLMSVSTAITRADHELSDAYKYLDALNDNAEKSKDFVEQTILYAQSAVTFAHNYINEIRDIIE